MKTRPRHSTCKGSAKDNNYCIECRRADDDFYDFSRALWKCKICDQKLCISHYEDHIVIHSHVNVANGAPSSGEDESDGTSSLIGQVGPKIPSSGEEKSDGTSSLVGQVGPKIIPSPGEENSDGTSSLVGQVGPRIPSSGEEKSDGTSSLGEADPKKAPATPNDLAIQRSKLLLQRLQQDAINNELRQREHEIQLEQQDKLVTERLNRDMETFHESLNQNRMMMEDRQSLILNKKWKLERDTAESNRLVDIELENYETRSTVRDVLSSMCFHVEETVSETHPAFADGSHLNLPGFIRYRMHIIPRTNLWMSITERITKSNWNPERQCASCQDSLRVTFTRQLRCCNRYLCGPCLVHHSNNGYNDRFIFCPGGCEQLYSEATLVGDESETFRFDRSMEEFLPRSYQFDPDFDDGLPPGLLIEEVPMEAYHGSKTKGAEIKKWKWLKDEMLSAGLHPPNHSSENEWSSDDDDSRTITTSQQQSSAPAAVGGVDMLMTSQQYSPEAIVKQVLSDGLHPPNHSSENEWNTNDRDSRTITTSQQQAPAPTAVVGAGILKPSEEQSPAATAKEIHSAETEHAFVLFTTDKTMSEKGIDSMFEYFSSLSVPGPKVMFVEKLPTTQREFAQALNSIIIGDPSRKHHLWFDSDWPWTSDKLAFVSKLSFLFDATVEVVFFDDTKKTIQKLLNDALHNQANDCAVAVQADTVVQIEIKSKPHPNVFPKSFGEAKLGFVDIEYLDTNEAASRRTSAAMSLVLYAAFLPAAALIRLRKSEVCKSDCSWELQSPVNKTNHTSNYLPYLYGFFEMFQSIFEVARHSKLVLKTGMKVEKLGYFIGAAQLENPMLQEAIFWSGHQFSRYSLSNVFASDVSIIVGENLELSQIAEITKHLSSPHLVTVTPKAVEDIVSNDAAVNTMYCSNRSSSRSNSRTFRSDMLPAIQPKTQESDFSKLLKAKDESDSLFLQEQKKTSRLEKEKKSLEMEADKKRKCLEATEAQLKAEKGKVQALTKTNNSLIANKRMQSSIPEVHVPNLGLILETQSNTLKENKQLQSDLMVAKAQIGHFEAMNTFQAVAGEKQKVLETKLAVRESEMMLQAAADEKAKALEIKLAVRENQIDHLIEQKVTDARNFKKTSNLKLRLAVAETKLTINKKLRNLSDNKDALLQASHNSQIETLQETLRLAMGHTESKKLKKSVKRDRDYSSGECESSFIPTHHMSNDTRESKKLKQSLISHHQMSNPGFSGQLPQAAADSSSSSSTPGVSATDAVLIQTMADRLCQGGVRSLNATRYANILFVENITTIARLTKNFRNKPGFLASIFDKEGDIEDITDALEVLAPRDAAMVASSTVAAAAGLPPR